MGVWVAHVCIRGLTMTFKKDVPDIRNSRVIDIVRELERFGICAKVHDPLALAEETRHEYDVVLTDMRSLRPLTLSFWRSVIGPMSKRAGP